MFGTEPTITGGVTLIKAAHIIDLRSNLDAARAALGLSAMSYTDAKRSMSPS